MGLIPFLATIFFDLLAGLEMEEAILAGAAAAETAEYSHAAFVLVAAALSLIPFLATTFLDLLAGLEMEKAILAGAAAAAFVGLPVTRGITHTATA